MTEKKFTRKMMYVFKPYLNLIICLLLIFSLIQLLPHELDIIQPTDASSSYYESDWSAEGNSSGKNQVRIEAGTGNVKLVYGTWMYVDDTYNYRMVHTMFGGAGWTTYGAWGWGTGNFRGSFGFYVDVPKGMLYVADGWNNRIVKTPMGGTGWTTYGSWGNATGRFRRPYDVHYDAATGFLYIADTQNHRIVKTKMSGTGWTTYGTSGSSLGQFNNPSGIYYDSQTQFIYVADTNNHRIVKTMIDGTGWEDLGSFGNHTGEFKNPGKIFYDNSTDHVYVGDTANHRIVKTMMNGSGWTTYGGTQGSNKGQFNNPNGIYYHSQTGYIYVADTSNNRIVRTTMNGSGWATFSGASSSNFNYPYDVFPTNQSYSPTGYIVSRKIDLGSPIDLLKLNWLADTPTGTSVRFQLRSAPNETALDGKSFVGPNGSGSKYYTSPGQSVWGGHVGDQWVQYRASLSTTKEQQTPVLKNVTIVYNKLPKAPTLLYPANNNQTNDNTTTFIWKHNDLDSSGQIAYQWQVDNNKNFLSIDYDSKLVSSTISSHTSSKVIADGYWFWRVRTQDSDDGWGPYSIEKKVLIDTTAPVSEISKPTDNVFYKKINSISGTTTDPNVPSGVNRTELAIKDNINSKYWDGSGWAETETWLPTMESSGVENWEYNSTAVTWTSGQSYTIRTRAYDNVTNLEIPTKGIVVHYDDQAPVSEIQVPVNNSAHNKLSEISGNSYDVGGVGVNNVQISILQEIDNKYWNGKNWISSKSWLTTAGTTDWVYDSRKVLWNTGEYYTITSKATDKLSIPEYGLKSMRFIFDIDRPEAAVEVPSMNSYMNEIDTIYGNATDEDGSGIDTIEINIKRKSDDKYWDGKEWSLNLRWLMADGMENWTYDSSEVAWISDKYYIITPRATDFAENYKISEPGNSFMFDNKKPTLEFKINNNANYTNSTNVKLTISALDSGSGVDEMTFSQDQGVTWSAWVKYDSEYIYNFSAGDGEKKLYMQVNDRAENTGEIVNKKIILDTVEPINSIEINSGSEYTNSKLILLALSATDSLSGISEMSFSHDLEYWSAWEPYNNIKDYSLSGADGKKTVYFRVRDKAGNTAIASKSIILDTTPPSNLELEIDDGALTTKSTKVELKLSATDIGSGLDQMSFCSLDQDWCDWEDYSETREFELSPKNGQKIIYFRVTDKAGNIAQPVSASITLALVNGTTGPTEDEPEDEKGFELFSMMNIVILIIVIVVILILAMVIKRRGKKRAEEQAAKEEESRVQGQQVQAQEQAHLGQPESDAAQLPAVPAEQQQPQPQLPPAQVPAQAQTQTPPQYAETTNYATATPQQAQPMIYDSVMRDGVAVPISTTTTQTQDRLMSATPVTSAPITQVQQPEPQVPPTAQTATVPEPEPAQVQPQPQTQPQAQPQAQPQQPQQPQPTQLQPTPEPQAQEQPQTAEQNMSVPGQTPQQQQQKQQEKTEETEHSQ